MIFAAGLRRGRRRGRDAPAPARGARRRRATLHLLGPNTNLNAFETFRDDLPGQADRADHPERATRAGPIFQAPGARHPPVALGADRQRGRPRVRRLRRATSPTSPRSASIAAYIEGFKDGRTLHARRRPRRAARRADRVRQGGPHRRGPLDGQGPHRPPHRLRRRDVAPCSASSASPGSTASTSCWTPRRCSPARRRADADAATACASTRSPAAPAPTWPTWPRPPGCAPRPHRRDADGSCTSGSPTTCGCRTRSTTAARRRPTGAAARSSTPSSPTPTSACSICPITGALPSMSNRLARTWSTWPRPPTSRSSSIWGSPVGDEDGLPRHPAVVSEARRCSARSATACSAVRAYLDYHAFRARYRSPFTRPVRRPLPRRSPARPCCAPAPALSEHESKQLLAAYGIPVTRDVLVTSREAKR